ncbi:MAG TPA: hypothetical protein VFU28_05430 [Vicinamibacterales bacterium]|nr:hypothetical protein [Vicinamibacterales bacterium]
MKSNIARTMTVIGTNTAPQQTMAKADRQRVCEHYASVLSTTANSASPPLA